MISVYLKRKGIINDYAFGRRRFVGRRCVQLFGLVCLTMAVVSWAVWVFFQESSPLYEAFRNGRASSLPDLPLQYADFARWQREELAGARLAEGLNYWKQQLAGARSGLKLPSAHSYPAMPTHRCP